MNRNLKKVFLLVAMIVTALVCLAFSASAETITPATNNILESISIDKTLMSEGETATITVKVIEGYTAKYLYFYKPITNNTESVYLYLDSNNTYRGTFSVDDQTESGIWKAKYLSLRDSNDEYIYLYNSNTYTGTYYDKTDLSSLNFEVTGTEADTVTPVIEHYSIDKNMASAGENITVTVQITDEHLPASFWFWFKSPSNESKCITMRKTDNTGLYQGSLSIDENSEIGVWNPYYFTVSDTNGNSTTLYNSKVASYGYNKVDLSSLNFEIVKINEDEENTDTESFIVIFKDGYGNILSTQRVDKGTSAIEPAKPTNELYLFNGWDTDFTNITSNITITATWVLNPNITYDKETHIGKTFNIEVYSTANQTYTITCSDDIELTSNMVSSSIIFTDQLYYAKKYEIKANQPGSYLFYVKGSRSSNTLTYKVKISDHEFDTEWVTDKEATCNEDGSKFHKCKLCEATTDVTLIEKLGHDYSSEWTIDIKATCTESGSKSHHCSRCEAITDVTIVENLGHNYSNEWTIDNAATCLESGSKSRHCTRCNDKTDLTKIDITPHTYYRVVTPATTFSNGTIALVCSCGDIQTSETIESISSITLSSTEYVYNGKNKTPKVTIKASNGNALVKNVDYKLTVSANRSAIGRHTIKVTFIGNYEGSSKVYFYILPGKSASVKSATQTTSSITLKWSAVKGAAGYTVYRYSPSKKAYVKAGTTEGTSYTVENLYSGTKYTFRVVAYGKTNAGKIYNSKSYASLKTATETELPNSMALYSPAKGKANLSWTDVKGETGYQVYYSTKYNSGYKKFSNYKANVKQATVTALSSNKEYYFKLRTYIKTDSGYVYSDWSPILSITVN